MRRLIVLVMLIGSSFAYSTPNVATQGDCSGVASNGGKVDTRCVFVSAKTFSASRGRVLVISEAWLSPAPGFMSPDVDHGLNEQAVLTTVVRNLTDEAITVNAVRLEILGRSSLKKKGGLSGVSILQPIVGDTKPIVVPPGQRAPILFGETLILDGIIDAIEEENNLDNALVLDDFNPVRLNGKDYVQRFSKLMESRYGKATQLRVTYFTGDYQVLAQMTIPISGGTNFFYQGETLDKKTGRHAYRPLLAYDAFLGEYLKAKEIWVPGFHIRETPVRCIDVVPNVDVPGRMTYRDAECQPKKKD